MDDRKKVEERSQQGTAPKMSWQIKAGLGFIALFLLVFLFKEKESVLVNEREGLVGSSSPIQGNRPPQIFRAEIVPPLPDLHSAVRVELQAEDADQDPMTYRYRWLVNQKEVSDQAVLPLAGFKQGDLVSVEVTPSDEKTAGVSFQSNVVKIGNNPPAVTTIQLSPLEPKAGEAIRADVKGMDKDDDAIHYRYEWRVNGQAVAEGDADTIDGTLVHSADRISVMVTPFDRFSEGTPKGGPLVTVLNQSPQITSLPSGEVKDNKYAYQVVAQDPDGDPLHYLLVGGPPGMAIDAASGFLEWQAENLHENKSQVTIEVNDAKGGKSIQQFTLQMK